MKEQQIQRYESNDYDTANLDKLLMIAKSMNVKFVDTKAILYQEEINVDGYDAAFLQNATNKLRAKRTLFAV